MAWQPLPVTAPGESKYTQISELSDFTFKSVEIDLHTAVTLILFGMAEALTIPENAVEAVLDFNA